MSKKIDAQIIKIGASTSSGWRPFLRLPANFPVGKRVAVSAARTLPCAIRWVSAALMFHYHHNVAVQAHGRHAVYQIRCLLFAPHYSSPPDNNIYSPGELQITIAFFAKPSQTPHPYFPPLEGEGQGGVTVFYCMLDLQHGD